MKKKKLKVGVVGLGRIYPRHVDDSIKQIPELELVAVCDYKEEVAKKVAEKENVAYYSDYHKLIKDKNVDVVAVCAPNGFHFDIGMAAAENNKHCVMEKPIAQTYKDAKKLVAAFKKSKGNLYPVLQVRFNPAVQIVREYVRKGALGRILTAAVTIRWSRPQEYFAKSDWKGTLKLDGGSLLTQGIHYIDIMQYILGPAKSVFGKFANVAHKIEAEDIANAIIDMQSDTRVNLEFTICTYPHNLECSLTVLGETGTIKLGGTAMNKCELWEVKNAPQPEIPDGTSYAGGIYAGVSPNHKSIYENLVNTLIYGKKSFIKAEDALESLRIIDGIKESSEKGKEILLRG